MLIGMESYQMDLIGWIMSSINRGLLKYNNTCLQTRVIERLYLYVCVFHSTRAVPFAFSATDVAQEPS